MLSEVLLIIVGIVGLWVSSEVLIKSAQAVAAKLKLSETFLGLTLLSIGTTLPEMGTHIVSSIAILRGTDLSGIALSTNIGSNIVQITAILGIVAFFLKIKSDKRFLDSDYIVMLLAIILLFVFGFNGHISRLEGGFLLGLYLIYLWKLGRSEHIVGKVENTHARGLWIHALLIPLGFLFLFLSSYLAVHNGEQLATLLNVEDTFIGALLLGLGTALPELAAALVAIKRKSSGMSIGVLVGSNITNPLFGIGLGALISTYTMSHTLLWLDIPFWFFVSVLALLFFWRKMNLEKKEAAMLVFA